MSIILSVAGVSFAAFCVWLAVRIVNRRERWAKWTLVLTVGLPVLYVASFGPWCWVVSHSTNSDKFVPVPAIFEPLTRCFRTGRAGDALEWYTKLGAAGGSFWHADGGLDPVDNSISFSWCWMCPYVR